MRYESEVEHRDQGTGPRRSVGLRGNSHVLHGGARILVVEAADLDGLHLVERAAARGCATIKVETQNVNLPGCRFYRRQGCTLGSIERFAYPDLPGEARLIWYKSLVDEGGGRRTGSGN